MKIIIFYLSVFFFVSLCSCSKKLSDSEIESDIKMYYSQMGSAAGGGSWHADEVKILKKEVGKKGDWLITSETKGIYESPPLGNPVPDELFCDTLKFTFRQNEHDFWECDQVQ